MADGKKWSCSLLEQCPSHSFIGRVMRSRRLINKYHQCYYAVSISAAMKIIPTANNPTFMLQG